MLNPELFRDPGWAACIIATISLRKTTRGFSIRECPRRRSLSYGTRCDRDLATPENQATESDSRCTKQHHFAPNRVLSLLVSCFGEAQRFHYRRRLEGPPAHCCEVLSEMPCRAPAAAQSQI